MPTHDETSPVGPRAGSVRRPAPARTRPTGGGGGAARGGGGARRPAVPPAGRGRPTAGRSSGGGAGRPPASGGRPPGAGGPPGSGRPPGSGGRPPSGGRPSNGKGRPARTKKQRRRRRLKIGLGVLGGLFVLLGVFIGVVYASTDVPSPDSITNAQTTVVYYADGTTEIARLGDENRTNVPLDQVSEAAQHAVLAAENRDFYTDPGISATGIVRAAWNNLTGGSTQGGSTITQQYVKNAILQNSEQTFSRKFQELFLAIKLDNNYSKEQILENYLNTIYYGRGAYGIESAANTYFGVPASQLTAEQAAVLAVLIRSPGAYDPADNPEGNEDRWGLVLDAMVEEGWMSAEDRALAVYPVALPKVAPSLGIPAGPEGLIVSRALDELRTKGYTDDQLYGGGLKIVTTVDKRSQDIAVASVAEVMEGQNPEGILREALVAVDPRTGAVQAYYGGPNGTGTDYAINQRQPGSSVKPYVLATALEEGIGVTARRDGSASKTFPDRPDKPVRNSGGASCPACTLEEAMKRSLNTTYYGLTYELGAEEVRERILAATGMPETWESGNRLFIGNRTLADPQSAGVDSGLGIGQYDMRPIDQAVGFGTFASGGIRRDAYFVARVTDSEGTVLLENRGQAGEQVMDARVANDVSYALREVASYSKRALAGDRPVASKTGTVGSSDEENADAWMVGYTPSLSAAVWIGSDAYEPIRDARGRIIYGSGLPGAIWKTFMDGVLEGAPEEKMPTAPTIKGDTGEGVAEPAPETTTEAAPRTQESTPTTPAPANGGTDTGTGTGQQPPGTGGTGQQPPGTGGTGQQPPGTGGTGQQPPGTGGTGQQPPGTGGTGQQPPGTGGTGQQPPVTGGGTQAPEPVTPGNG
ncbi:transglycosylase domain-containing protein [Blastococcus sp. SYSU D01042]